MEAAPYRIGFLVGSCPSPTGKPRKNLNLLTMVRYGEEMYKLSMQEKEMYKRQMILSKWGDEKQLMLKSKSVLVVGAGGLGSPASINLALAGVGEIRICDYDIVEYSNLNRQTLHNKSKIGMNKALSAKETLEHYNENIKVNAFTDRLTAENVSEIVGNADVIIDCLDNFETRFILNHYSIERRIPIVYGSVWGFDGRISFINYPETPCLQCIFEEAPSKEVFPIIGATASVIGSLQAMEAIKYLAENGNVLKNKLLIWEGNTMSFRIYKLIINKNCVSCAKQREEDCKSEYAGIEQTETLF